MNKKNFFAMFIVLLITVILNIVAWNDPAFCDGYAAFVLPLWINSFGRLCGMFSFSVGECMIVTGVILAVLAVVLGLVTVIFLLIPGLRKRTRGFRIFCEKYYLAMSWILIGVFTVLTLNCFILYHTSDFSDKYQLTGKEEYTFEELCLLREQVVATVNTLAKEVPRDENGQIVYPENMEETAILSMQKLGERYDLLKGYYPEPKPLAASGFFSQQNMKGYFFPFSMEANYNALMNEIHRPATMCHELAHLKGFIQEDEANLISYLACTQSDDIVFQYSGYLSILNYIDNDFYAAVGSNKAVYKTYPAISKQVKKDNTFLHKETWAAVEKKAVIQTQVVSQASQTFVEKNLVMNGVTEGTLSYANVVGLLLDYYYQNDPITEPVEYLASDTDLVIGEN
ncbi:MAG: DUF3810 domain-containing protein [Clostridia bacterium]|nr:DUF3810 domain-containing protein [Clostridia bacterium]